MNSGTAPGKLANWGASGQTGATGSLSKLPIPTEEQRISEPRLTLAYKH